MSRTDDSKLLALLVHRSMVDANVAREALASGDSAGFLVSRGVITREQWEEWQRTEAGTRPELSRYELGELLGEGGVARVFRARDRKTGDTVALKVLRPSLSKDPAKIEQFVREARLLMALSHPNIVRGMRVAREGGVFFFAMEVVEGQCLQDVLEEVERLPEEEALAVVVQIARALDHLHGRGLVHRDVKPGNIMWSPAAERAVLIDLGFAVEQARPAGGGETTAGTVHYIAPEQARGQTDLDVRADIYALGATLYHLVTGSLPFAGATGEEVLAKQVLESLSGERIRALHLSPQVHYFIEKMMAKEKEIRFQDPEQLAQDVKAYLDRLAHERKMQEGSKRKLGQARRERQRKRRERGA